MSSNLISIKYHLERCLCEKSLSRQPASHTATQAYSMHMVYMVLCSIFEYVYQWANELIFILAKSLRTQLVLLNTHFGRRLAAQTRRARQSKFKT